MKPYFVEPMITCRDTDDPEYWAARLNAADQDECDALLLAMLNTGLRLRIKGIPATVVDARLEQGEEIYVARFSTEFVPF